MVSFEARLVTHASSTIASIAALCALATGIAQPAPDEDVALERIVGSIVQARAEGGTYAKELIEPLTDLSVLYRERGDYVLEAVTLENALRVVRANYGLKSLEQVPLLRQRITGAESVGNFAEAWELEQALLTLAERHPDDPRTVPVLHEIGDKRMQLLREFLSGERPPGLILGCFYEAPARYLADRNCEAGSRRYAARRMLVDAQGHYANALAVLRSAQEHAGAELDALETKLYRNSYLLRDYGGGRRSLVRRIFDDAARAEPALRRIDRLVELADWDLVFGERTLAYDLYAETYAYLAKQDGARAHSGELFAPAVPILLPKFLPNMLAAERADGATGYVDVEFDVTRFGTTRRIKVLDAHDASNAAENRISRWLVDNRFRPQVVDGEAVDARYVVRHYVHE